MINQFFPSNLKTQINFPIFNNQFQDFDIKHSTPITTYKFQILHSKFYLPSYSIFQYIKILLIILYWIFRAPILGWKTQTIYPRNSVWMNFFTNLFFVNNQKFEWNKQYVEKFIDIDVITISSFFSPSLMYVTIMI